MPSAGARRGRLLPRTAHRPLSSTSQTGYDLRRSGIRGYAAVVDPEAVGLPMTAFISVKPFDPSAPDDIAERLAGVPEIEACHSVAGEENYILKVRVGTPHELENLLSHVRSLAGVSTRTTV